MIAPAQPLPIEVQNADAPISRECAQLVAAILLDVADREIEGEPVEDANP